MNLPRQVKLHITYGEEVSNTGVSNRIKNQNIESGEYVENQDKYTVVQGDNLWNLAKRFLGSGKRSEEIYKRNAAVIEESARKHGRKNSRNGHWIYPGTELIIVESSKRELNLNTNVDSVEEETEKENAKLSEDIASHVSELTYSDIANGKSDSINLTISNLSMRWMGEKMPKKGAEFGLKIQLQNWNNEKEGEKIFECGTFILDDISFSGRPLQCVIGGVSAPVMDDFKSLPRTKTWEKTTLQNIASEIAQRANVQLHFEADEIQIEEMEQSKQTDSSFLSSLCEKYGLAMKIYKHKIVIFDFIRYEKKEPILTLKESDFASWDYNVTVDGTYTGVKFDYTNPDEKDPISVTIGTTGRMYAMNAQASGKYDAELQAMAKVNEANRKMETLQVSMRANTNIIAGSCVNVTGLENASGKYFVDSVTHNIGTGYKMQISMHKVQKPIGVGNNDSTGTPVDGEQSQRRTHTVMSGESLWKIANKFYGSGRKFQLIYAANADLIEESARKHGRKNSKNGHWIYPGDTFVIPEEIK